MKYNGSSTLKENVIPGIDVDKLQILDDTYIEENIEYNYGEDIVKQPDRKVITFGVKMLIVILILVVIVGLMAYIRGR